MSNVKQVTSILAIKLLSYKYITPTMHCSSWDCTTSCSTLRILSTLSWLFTSSSTRSHSFKRWSKLAGFWKSRNFACTSNSLSLNKNKCVVKMSFLFNVYCIIYLQSYRLFCSQFRVNTCTKLANKIYCLLFCSVITFVQYWWLLSLLFDLSDVPLCTV